MRLLYIGPPSFGTAPLPEGWPAADHDEPDPAARAAKLAYRLATPGDAKGAPSGGPAYEKAEAAPHRRRAAASTEAPQ